MKMRWIAVVPWMVALITPVAARADEPVKFNIYGFINPTVIVTYGQPETFGRANASAITEAANPILSADKDDLTHTLQVAQSRIGLKIESPFQTTGVLEVDFIDFQKSTPTLAMQPRLRVASVTKRFGAEHRLVAGQLWDLHAYVQPFHTNFVGAHFQAGNSAFMRLQVQYVYETPGVEIGAALGMPAANVGPAMTSLEHDGTPTLAARAMLKLGEEGKARVGASAIVGQLAPAPDETLLSWAGALLMDLDLGALGMRGEAYMGQNAANISLLSLSQGRVGQDMRELGGFVSAKYVLNPAHRVTLTAGMASLLNDEDALPAYAYLAPGGAASAAPAQGPGIKSNVHVRAGWVWKMVSGLELAIEPFWLRTDHVLDATDSAKTSVRQMFGTQSSLIYTF